MNNYTPNSHKYREEQKKASEEKKKIQKVIKGSATIKKKNIFQKMVDVFISEDASNIKDYVVNDMIVPTGKKIILGVIDMLLNGGHSTYTSDRFAAPKVSYRKYYDGPRDDRPLVSSSARARFDHEDIEFETRGEAEAVLDEMFNVIDRYNLVTVGDMYDMVDLPQPFTSNKYGWTNLRGASVVRVGGKYIIKLPKAMPID